MSTGVDACELRITEGKGEGVFANRSFRVRELVLEGVIERRLSENTAHASQVGLFEFVLLGGLGPKVNHSCDPNCGVRVNDSGAYDLIARRDIMPGEEITFDYAMRNYSIEHFPAQCLVDLRYAVARSPVGRISPRNERRRMRAWQLPTFSSWIHKAGFSQQVSVRCTRAHSNGMRSFEVNSKRPCCVR